MLLFCVTLLLGMGSQAQGQCERFEPLPRCSDCVPAAQIVTPGIGFDLTTSYGTAAIRFHNGTVVAVGRSHGNSEYKSLMLRLSSESSRCLQPGSPTLWEELRYQWCRAKRRANKLAGRPATPDVGTLSRLIRRLRRQTEERLEQPITSAMVAAPNLPGLDEEDIDDALEHAGLTSLKSWYLFSQLSETSATWAGSGLGLCSNYMNIDKCEAEECLLPTHTALVLSFSRRAFGASISSMRVAYSDSVFGKSILDWDAGLNSLPTYPTPEAYWDQLRTKVQELPLRTRKHITMLLLHGEEALNETFLDVVRDALRDIQGLRFPQVVSSSNSEPVPLSTGLDPLFVVAKGAAEFAKRWLEAPRHCKEPDSCWERRRRLEER